MKLARWIERGVLAALLLAGLLCTQGPRAFYASLALAFVGIAGTLLVGAAIVTAIAERSTSRLQGPRRLPRFSGRAAKDTALAALVAASLLAWPLARLSSDEPTGLVWDVEAAGGLTVVILGWFTAIAARRRR